MTTSNVLATISILLAICFGIFAIYTFYFKKKPDISFEILSESNVLDIHKPLDDLIVLFKGEDIQKSNLNLKIITTRITNSGDFDILHEAYAEELLWGFKVINAEVIDQPRLVNTNDSYLLSNVNPTLEDSNTISFQKILFDRDKYFTIETLIIHHNNNQPSIETIGKISGIDKIIPQKVEAMKADRSIIKLTFMKVVALFVSLIFSVFLAWELGGYFAASKHTKMSHKQILEQELELMRKISDEHEIHERYKSASTPLIKKTKRNR